MGFYGAGCQVPSTLSQRRSQSPHQASGVVNGHPEWLGEWRRQVSETYQRHEWHVMPSGKSMNGISGRDLNGAEVCLATLQVGVLGFLQLVKVHHLYFGFAAGAG